MFCYVLAIRKDYVKVYQDLCFRGPGDIGGRRESGPGCIGGARAPGVGEYKRNINGILIEQSKKNDFVF